MMNQLFALLEQLALRSDSHHIEAAQVAAVLQETGFAAVAWVPAPETGLARVSAPAASALAPRPLPEQIAALEQQAIRAALAYTRGNRTAAAKLLGISRASFYDRLAGMPDVFEVSEN